MEHEKFETDSTGLESSHTNPEATELLDSAEAEEKIGGLMRWDEALNLEAQVEAILFAAPKPISVQEISDLLEDDEGPQSLARIEPIIASLVKLYRERNGGFRLEYDKGVGYQFRTVPAAAPLMERMFSSRQRPLSRAALETLAIIAYRQPVTRADIEAIRGVDAGSIIKNLLDRELISCVGRKEDSGRPMMFGTSPEFLRVFRIASLDDLPPLSAFQPSPETMSEAEDRLELGEEVDVDDFIRDIEQDKPRFSPGLDLEAESGDFTHFEGEIEVRDSLEEQDSGGADSSEKSSRAGARYDAKGFYEHDRIEGQGDTDPEVVITTGLGVSERSRENADGGSDFDQRQSRERTRDED
ncbi:MAG: SMC-Scp complex subunit ScpB [Proteobacteria bacterium]|nr:SMC-Scp complex subunit ScpB [Pseudomonadota bacterium]